MSKTKNFNTWLVTGGVLAFLYYQFGSLKNIAVQFSGVKFGSINLMSSTIYLGLEVSNPANGGVTIKHILGSLLLNEQTIGTIQGLNINTYLAGNASTTLQIPVKLSNLGLFFSLKDAIVTKTTTGNLVANYQITTNFATFSGSQAIPLYL